MRFGLSAWAAIWLGLVYVAGTLLLHAWSCSYRLDRARRLYDAGNLREADRVLAAVRRAVTAFEARHPHWRVAA